MNKKNKISYNIIAVVFVILAVGLDQFTKHLAEVKLKDNAPFVVVKNVFELYYLENKGAAFGILENHRIIFVIISVVVLIAIVFIYQRLFDKPKFVWLRVVAVLIASGAIGNLIDRVRYAYVVDFFYFKPINFPVFNVADIYMTVSTFLLVFLIIFYYKEDDFEKLISNRK
jgi:signal peptidase II